MSSPPPQQVHDTSPNPNTTLALASKLLRIPHQPLQLLRHRAGEPRLLLPVLPAHEGRHGFHAHLLRDVLRRVHVHLVEPHVLELLRVGVLLEDGGDGLAGPAPGGPEVEDGGLRGVDDVVEFLDAVCMRGLVNGLASSCFRSGGGGRNSRCNLLDGHL